MTRLFSARSLWSFSHLILRTTSRRNLKDQNWKWLTPGAVAGVLLWLLISFAFRGYLRFFNTDSVTYGSLGAVIILMLWFYFTGAAILIGGEVNSEIDAAAKARSTIENCTTSLRQ